MRQWMRYAQLEIDSSHINRARSIFERALAVDYTYVPLWLRYSRMEIVQRQFSHARAIFDRSVTLLPYETKLWLSYIEMEELLDNIDSCRSILERWTLDEGGSVAWKTWYSFEKKNRSNCLEVLERWVSQQPGNLQAWTLLAEQTDERSAYSRAIDSNMLSDTDKREAFSRWRSYELSKGERARADALGQIGGLSDTNPNYHRLPYKDVESWWVEISLRAKDSESGSLSDVYKVALLQSCPIDKGHKTNHWRKYALLWLRFAIYTEKKALPAQHIYEDALAHWPHAKFTSVTLWKAYAEYEIRQNHVEIARKIYGSALGKTHGNSRIFENYIDLEKRLLSTEAVRRLYTKYCWTCNNLANAWTGYATFEASLKEYERAGAIFDVAVSLSSIENADPLWIAWAEMEADNGDFNRSREIWNKALKHDSVDVVNMWAHFAMFEISTGLGDDEEEVDNEAVERARAVFTRAFNDLRQHNTERLHLFDLFIQFEENYGSEETLNTLRKKAPKPVTKVSEDGETYIEHEFPEMETSAISKLLANAKKWAETNASN